MSLIKAIKAQLGLSVTPANNFTLDASADNGTMKLARNSGQDIMTVDAAGLVGFNVGILGFVYSAGTQKWALKLPSWLGGWTINWGLSGIPSNSGTAVSYLIPYSTSISFLIGAPALSLLSEAAGGYPICALVSNSSLTAWTGYAGILLPNGTQASGSFNVSWLAIGK